MCFSSARIALSSFSPYLSRNSWFTLEMISNRGFPIPRSSTAGNEASSLDVAIPKARVVGYWVRVMSCAVRVRVMVCGFRVVNYKIRVIRVIKILIRSLLPLLLLLLLPHREVRLHPTCGPFLRL